MRGKYEIVRVVDGRPLVTCRREDLPMVTQTLPTAIVLDEDEMAVVKASGVRLSDDEVILTIKKSFPGSKLRRVIPWQTQPKVQQPSPSSPSPFRTLLGSRAPQGSPTAK